MTEHFHAIVWIDHAEAKVFHCNAEEADKLVLHADGSPRHHQHKANVHGAGHKGVDKEFFSQVADSLTHTGAILVVGPGNARVEFKHFVTEHFPQLAQRISGVEALDHPTDNQLIALARKFFRADDLMNAQVR
jgi:stalled ribosome rescue protein Dom34